MVWYTSSNDGVGRDDALLDRARHRDHLVGRARLVHVGDRAVVLGRRRRRARARCRWRRRPSPSRARRRSARRRSTAVPPLAFIATTPCEQRLLGVPLQRRVDGEHEVLPALRRRHLALATGDVVALRVALDLHAPRRAGEQLVEVVLDAAEAVVVGADEADHRRGERSDGVEAPRLVLVRDADEVELADLARRPGRRPCGRRTRTRSCGSRGAPRAQPGRPARSARASPRTRSGP